MKNLITTLFLLITITATAQSDKRLNGVEKDLNKILEATEAAGFAVAVVDKNRIVYSKGFGYSDLENKIPANGNTLFAIGSTTKAFTSAILGQLRDGDSLSFDDNPRKYLPNLEFYNDELNSNVIIKDLMRHSTGIPRHDISWYLFPTESADSLLTRIKDHEPFTGLRQAWYYNNFMFLVQGEIARKLTGKSWGENIKELFFKPLNMTRSNVSIDELLEKDNKAIGYRTNNDGLNKKLDYYRISGMRAAGSINSSVNEMSKWLITWINNGKYNDDQIIPEAYRNEAMSSQMVVGSALPNEETPDIHFATYGYGWFMTSYKSHYRVEHGGNIDGFSANVAFYPSDSLGIVVLSNQDGSRVPTLVRNTIADRMLKVNKTDWIQRYLDDKNEAEKIQNDSEEEGDQAQVNNTKPSHNLIEYTGNYSLDGYGNFDVLVKNDSLFANFKRMKVWLKHYHYNVFTPYEVKNNVVDTTGGVASQLKFNFTTNLSGDIATANIFLEPTLSDPMPFKRTPNTIDVDEKQLEAYFGEYELGSMVVKVFAKDGTLFAHVPGQTDYELLATAEHKFNLKILDDFKVEFLENDKGEIEAVNFIQPNGTFKANRKKE